MGIYSNAVSNENKRKKEIPDKNNLNHITTKQQQQSFVKYEHVTE